MLTSLLALALLPAASPSCPDASVRLGPATAASHVDAFLDPTSSSALGTVLELRRLVGERPGEVAVTMHWTHLGVRLDPRADRVRHWIAAMSTEGHALAAVRLVRRDGVDRMFVRLGTAHGRAGLAKALELPAAVIEKTAAQQCHAVAMEATRTEIAARMTDRGSAVFRLPVFAVDDLSFEDSGELDRLRPALAKRRSRARAAGQRPTPPLPPPRPSSARLRRPDVRAPALGGPGLPHTFVVLARSEDDPTLFTLLPPVLAYRRNHPGEVAVRIVTRGVGLENGLRHRLCLAQHAGLLPAYVHWLAQDPSTRLADPTTADLLDAVDGALPETPCDLDPVEEEEALPDGGWLDGVPLSRGELETLPKLLRQAEGTRRPLSPFVVSPVE